MATRRWSGSRTGHGAARIITGVGAVFALFEVAYILLILFNANPVNGFFRFVQSVAEPLALFFPGLFDLVNDKLEVVLNYGLAAVFWLVVTGRSRFGRHSIHASNGCNTCRLPSPFPRSC